MPILEPVILPPATEWELTEWTKNECYRFYIAQRRLHCAPKQLLNLWLRAPFCCDCMASEPMYDGQAPDVSPMNWADDIAWRIGELVLSETKQHLANDQTFTFSCKKCHRPIAPWNGDYLHVVSYHLEEHYRIPLETPEQVNPSDRVRKKIISLYGNACFGCGRSGIKLHIDHIMPRSRGGDAAFRNLQPLCEVCGQTKGDSLPEEIDVNCDIYFGPYPSDSYEGLFW